MPKSAIVRQELFDAQRGVCHYCRAQMTMTHGDLMCTIEHIKPRSRGGKNNRENLVGACWQCNGIRGSMDYDVFVANYAAILADRTLPKIRRIRFAIQGSGLANPAATLIRLREKQAVKANKMLDAHQVGTAMVEIMANWYRDHPGEMPPARWDFSAIAA